MARILLAMLAAAMLSACASFAPSVTYQVGLMQADRALAQAAQARGLAAAFTEAVDPIEGTLVYSGAVHTGQAAVKAELEKYRDLVNMRWDPDKGVVSSDGRFGVTTGRYTRILQGRDAGQGRYVTTWRKDAAGVWRVLYHVPQLDPTVFQPTPPPPMQTGPQSFGIPGQTFTVPPIDVTPRAQPPRPKPPATRPRPAPRKQIIK